jgi:hypothetical protein
VRGLECGPKLPTPRKMAEMGGLAMLPGATLPMHMAIGQPLSAPPLQIQIPANLQHGGGDRSYNLSSAGSDTQMPSPFASPTIPFPTPTHYTSTSHGFRPHSITSGFASLMSPMSLGITHHAVETCSVVRAWSQHSTTRVSPVSLEQSPELPSCEKAEQQAPQECMKPCIPARHPLHSLATSVLPIVRSQIPKVHDDEPAESPCGEEMSTAEQTPIDQEMYTDDQMWALWEETYLQFDNGPQVDEETNSGPLRLKWNRLLHVPRSMRKKALAGVWSDDLKIKKEDPESIQSLKSAPSIL